MPKHPGFTCAAEELRELAQAVLERARRGGASGCDCEVSEGYGLTVTVRKGRAETIEHNRDRSVGVTVDLGSRPAVRRGHASSSDLSLAADGESMTRVLVTVRQSCAAAPAGRVAGRRSAFSSARPCSSCSRT